MSTKRSRPCSFCPCPFLPTPRTTAMVVMMSPPMLRWVRRWHRERRRRRAPLYIDDWRQGTRVGVSIFAPATYIFFASTSRLTFGEQFRDETKDLFSIPHPCPATRGASVRVRGQPAHRGRRRAIVLVYYYIQVLRRSERLGYAPAPSARGFIFTAVILHPRLHARASASAHSPVSQAKLALLIALFSSSRGEGPEARVRGTLRGAGQYNRERALSVFLSLFLVLLAVFLIQ